MKQFRFFILLLCIVYSINLKGQEIPPIQIFSPEYYMAENQNWQISQSNTKNIYVANNKGLLEYNGAKWKLYNSPNETIIRSVNVIDDKIYTGCYREFGYWETNKKGQLTYTSLSQILEISFLDDEEIWNIIVFDDWILFQSLQRIYIYNKKNNSYRFLESETSIIKIFKLEDGIYFQEARRGIFKIENGKAKLIINDSIIDDNSIVNIFNHNDKLLLETQDNGFYILNNQSLTKWDITANESLSKVSVYNSIQLKDSSFILGTISNGILHLTPEGDINYDITRSDGLSNNTVLSIFEDIDSNVWLGLDNGINCINIKSPFKVFNDEVGNIGTVYASSVYENVLYLGTNQGLFFKPLDKNEKFQFIKETQGQVWCLIEINGTLFCGHNTGTYVVKNNQVNKILDILGTWNIKPVNGNEDILIQGNYDGLNVIERIDGTWTFKNRIEGFNISTKYFEILEDSNEIFVSHEYKGVFKLIVDDNFKEVKELQQVSSMNKGMHSSLVKYDNNILYAYNEGIFKYNITEKKFEKDTLLSNVFDKNKYSSGKLISNDKTNILWGFSTQEISYITPGNLSNRPEISKIPFPIGLRNDITGYENISFYSDNKYLLGTSSGYLIISIDDEVETNYQINIDGVSISNYKINDPFILVDKSNSGYFKNVENNIKFSYHIAQYSKYLETEYQYQLVGLYDTWSEWSKESSKFFENLPYGNYSFNVRARVGRNISDNVESYSFEIERPWYLSNIALIIYFLLILLFSLITHNSYKRYYRKQREKLLIKTTKDLELKELENRQLLMQFNNDKLRQDIENKNRELSVSTMSLIKKNEFLGNIKNELGKVENIQNIKHVTKIIDNNLNHTDDWNLFQEAFNNVDKDFLKKIKEKHPSLTHNDLRLCTYLRLNLSSKEVAPLLNISSRSVEVKRYRLRKKMNLSHETSLTNYILEI